MSARMSARLSTRARMPALIVAIMLVLLPAMGSADPFALPDFGSSADRLMSRAEERDLGQEFMKWVRKALPISDDPVLTDYLETLGQQLVAASGHPGRYRFFLIEEPTINAFAGPDGHIGVFAGLILATETEGELASVIAHELAHVSQGHLMRRFEAQKQMALPATALLLAAAVLGATVDAEIGTAGLMGVQGAAAQKQINFTRANEEEADRIGIDTLARAGHDPYAMPGFFQRLARTTRIADSAAPAFLRTHPVTTSRIADAMNRARQHGVRQRPDSLRFHLARANLRQRRESNPARAVEHFANTLEQGRYRDETAQRYGYALALTRAGRLETARKQLAPLIEAHPSQTEFLVLRAEIDRRAGKPERAVRDLKGAVGLAPGNWPLNQAYAEASMAAGKPAQALAALERFVAQRSDIAPIYELMADAAGQAGQRALNHRYRAEYLYHSNELEPAIRQLELALRLDDLDFHLASRLQVRLAELKALEHAREARN
ncbi:MAG: M48 family metalloprotease [Halochromatium sp.]|uniref:M48 family metalloprotease n=1 Tax=Halochromatium sp. TaxID=2049430 RepID=UPI003979F478